VASTWLDTMRPLVHIIWTTLVITLFVLVMAIAVKFFQLTTVVVIPLSLIIIFCVTVAVWLMILPQKIRQEISIRIRNE
jgi:hypothetical protein